MRIPAHFAAAALVGLFLAACHHAAPAPEPVFPWRRANRATAPEESSITIARRATFQQGLDLAQSAFSANGLAVSEPIEAGVVSSVPVVPDTRSNTPVEMTYHAAVLHAGRAGADSVRIVLTAEMSAIPQPGVPERTVQITSLTPSFDAAHGSHGWTKLQLIAAALRGR